MQTAGLSADFGAMIDSLSIGIISIREDSEILCMNRAAEQLLGVSKADVVSSQTRELIGKSGEFSHNGRWIVAEVTAMEHGHRLVQLHDVTTRKQAETALEANQEFLQAVLDNIEAGIVACDDTGTLKLFNNAARAFHGIGEQPVPPDEWADRYHLHYRDGTTPLSKEDLPLYRAFSGQVVRRQEILIAPAGGPPPHRPVQRPRAYGT